MQYSVSINQKAFQELAPDCDIIDAAIFDFIARFMATNAIDTNNKNDKIWYWISYQKIVDELPIIGIKSKRAIYNRMQKLIDAGLLESDPENQRTGKTYFAQRAAIH